MTNNDDKAVAAVAVPGKYLLIFFVKNLYYFSNSTLPIKPVVIIY
jgi:hypothetical protein